MPSTQTRIAKSNAGRAPFRNTLFLARLARREIMKFFERYQVVAAAVRRRVMFFLLPVVIVIVVGDGGATGTTTFGRRTVGSRSFGECK